VSASGVALGGLTSEHARARLEHAFGRSVTIVRGGGRTAIAPARLGAAADVDGAVTAALAAAPGSAVRVRVTHSAARLAAAVAALAKRYDRAPVSAAVTGATADGRPLFSRARAGLAVDVRAMRAAVARLLARGERTPLRLVTHPLAPKRTAATFGPVVVVTRGANRLQLFDGTRLVATFPVATGQAIYPTPAGLWRIVTMQRDPWWYPPTYDEWAKGLQPVPPGPSNPLGTRWMGLDAPGVGIHGTDAPSSIGYSASHGCIRMQVPDAEWLFDHVDVGTPVVIL
jgi:lipoprotein-anchoring transpeptidase ErfK/SrfK